MQAIYFGWELERLRMFQVVERITELFRQGLLPLGQGSAGRCNAMQTRATGGRRHRSARSFTRARSAFRAARPATPSRIVNSFRCGCAS